jgi:surface antigen
MLWACGNAPEGELLGVAREAVNACAETVPANRAVDGIPAYAQCAGIEDGAIWSSNGIDTASSSQGAGWMRTQNNGGYQCTELARRYFMFHWGIDYQHGNAGEWCDGTLPSTLTLSTSPTHGDLMVFAPGSCGADATTGHIAVVDTVDMAGAKVTIVEQNQASRRSTQQSCAKCFIHAVKNDGSAGGSGGSPSGGAGSGGAPVGGSPSSGAGGNLPSTSGASPGGMPSVGAGSSGGASGGPASEVAGSTSAGGPSSGPAGGAMPVGGAGASSGTRGSDMPASNPTTVSPTDDAGCTVSQPGSAVAGRAVTTLLFACAGLLFHRRRSQGR